MMQWSDPSPLSNFASAPREHGVYEIGFLRKNVFKPKYMGRASGKHSFLRGRLAKHFKGQGNREVRKYLEKAERNNLYFRYKQMPPDAACIFEAQEQLAVRFEWNDRTEEKVRCKKFARERP